MNIGKVSQRAVVVCLAVLGAACDQPEPLESAAPAPQTPFEEKAASAGVASKFGITSYVLSEQNGTSETQALDGQNRAVLHVRFGAEGVNWLGHAFDANGSPRVNERLVTDAQGNVVESFSEDSAAFAEKVAAVLDDLSSGRQQKSFRCWVWGTKCVAGAISLTACVASCATVAGCATCGLSVAGLSSCRDWLKHHCN
jgi:hypothetical protein